jgi:hypothetical protein
MGNYLCRTFPNLFTTRKIRVHEQYTNRCINCKSLYLSQFRDHICPGCRMDLTGTDRIKLIERQNKFSPKPVHRPTWQIVKPSNRSNQSNQLANVFPKTSHSLPKGSQSV